MSAAVTLAHGGAGGAPHAVPVLEAAGLLALAAAYLAGMARCRGGGAGWPARRTASFLAGVAVLALAVLPAPPVGGFPGHMWQHLLIGMVAPLGLVLGAPVTLALRALPPRYARRLGRALRTVPVRLVANPVTALVLTLGVLAALYFTPLYALTTDHDLLHRLVHLHFLVAGCLFAWVIAGPDPGPHRPSVPARLVVLGVAVAGHAALSQLIYAGAWVRVPAPADQLRAAGEIMYYGGDLAELALALVLLVGWRPDRRRAVAPRRGRPATPAGAGRTSTQA